MKDTKASVLDLEMLMKRYSQRQTFIFKLLNLLITETPKQLAELDSAMRMRDLSHLVVVAHTLKGMSANVCAGTVQQIARQVEQSAKDESEQAFIMAEQLKEQLLLLNQQAKAILGELDE